MTQIRTAFATLLVAIVATVCLVFPAGAAAVTPQLQATLGGQIQSLGSRIDGLRGRVNALQKRQNAAEAELGRQQAHQQQLARDLQASKARLARLKAKLEHAKKVLAARIVAIYKAGQPDYLNVVLQSRGFDDLVQRSTYLRHISQQDQDVIDTVVTLKAQTAKEATRLAGLERQARQLVAQVQSRRDSIASAKGKVAGQVGALSTQLRSTRRRLAAVTAAMNANTGPAPSPNGQVYAYSPPSLVPGNAVVLRGGSAAAPINAPAAIKAAVAAGNQIRSTPYIWGGGHGSFSARGYDCSGSVSYVLHAAGTLSSPLTSGALESWGAPGPGKWITVYANAGHTFMSVGGLWFDTVGLSSTGSRWQSGGKGTGGFVVRHPPGL